MTLLLCFLFWYFFPENIVWLVFSVIFCFVIGFGIIVAAYLVRYTTFSQNNIKSAFVK